MAGAADATLSAEGRNECAEVGRWKNTWVLEDITELWNCPNRGATDFVL